MSWTLIKIWMCLEEDFPLVVPLDVDTAGQYPELSLWGFKQKPHEPTNMCQTLHARKRKNNQFMWF